MQVWRAPSATVGVELVPAHSGALASTPASTSAGVHVSPDVHIPPTQLIPPGQMPSAQLTVQLSNAGRW
jgi:hypothetical protein